MLLSHFYCFFSSFYLFTIHSFIYLFTQIEYKINFDTRTPRLKCTAGNCPTTSHCLKNSQSFFPLLFPLQGTSRTRQKPVPHHQIEGEVLSGGVTLWERAKQ